MTPCKATCAGLISLLISATAGAQSPGQQPRGWTWGLGVVAAQDVYRDFDNRIVPIPLIGYQGERLRVFGPFASYDVIQQDGWSVSLNLAPAFAGYEEDDSDVFEGMADRDFSLLAGAGVQYRHNGWQFNLNAGHDVLDNSAGYEVSAGAIYQYRVGNWTIEPSLALTYWDASYVDYYYGVTASEARIGRAFYQADSTTNTQVGVAFSTRQFLGGMTRIQVSNTFFGSEVADSPLTDDDSAFSVLIAYSRFFLTRTQTLLSESAMLKAT